MDNAKIAEKILAKRERLGWSRRDLELKCELLGNTVHENTISRIESEAGNPRLSSLLAVCDALGLRVEVR